MAQKESRLSRRIMDAVRDEGHFCFKVHGSEHMMAGLPDIIVCAKGLFISLETKNPESRDDVSPRQRYVHGLIEDAEGIAHVVCSPAEAINVINDTINKFYAEVKEGYR